MEASKAERTQQAECFKKRATSGRKSLVKMFPSFKLQVASLLLLACLLGPQLASFRQVAAEEQRPPGSGSSEGAGARLAANHRTEEAEGEQPAVAPPESGRGAARQGRQYEAMGASGSGSYASVGPGGADSAMAGAYLGAGPAPSSAYGAASGEMGAYPALAAAGQGYHAAEALQYGRAGYPAAGQLHPQAYGPAPPPMQSMFPLSGPAGGGLLSSFPLAAKGFDVAEVVCTAVAVAIGAVIVGAPFILLYLFVMNQMQANGGGGGIGGAPGGGSISLTGPTSSTNVSGRKKRQTTFPEALLRQLSPLINSEQVANSFKLLMSSVAKYQM